MDGWMDGRTDACMHACMFLCACHEKYLRMIITMISSFAVVITMAILIIIFLVVEQVAFNFFGVLSSQNTLEG